MTTTSTPAPSAVPGRPDEKTLLFRDVLAALRKALKAARLYPHEHRLHQEGMEDFVRSLCSVLERTGSILLKVAETRLLSGEHAVFEDEEGEHLCRRLFADGVRAITLRPGVSRAEARELFDLFQSVLSRGSEPGVEDDFVTLFWDRGMPHVRLSLVEEFGVQLSEEETVAAREMAQRASHLSLLAGSLASPQEALPPEVAAYLEREVAREVSMRLPLRLGLILLGDLESGAPPTLEHLERTADLFTALVHDLVARADLLGAMTLVEAAEACIFPDPSWRARFLCVLEEFRKPGWVQDYLARPDSHADPGLPAFLLRLGPRIAEAVLRLVALEDRGRLLPLAETLVQMDSSPFLALAGSRDPKIAAAALRLAERCGLPVSLSCLEHHAGSPSTELRTLVARIATTTAGAGPLLEHLAGDEEEAVRVHALRGLARTRWPSAVPCVEAMAMGEGFLERSSVEKSEVLQALAVLAGEEAVPALARILKHRVWLRRSPRVEEAKLAAVRALELVPGEEAGRLLARACRRGPHAVREAARRALERRAPAEA